MPTSQRSLTGGELSSVAPDSAGRRGRKPGTVMAARPVKRGKRGSVSELILAGLKEAGDAGIAVKHLAVKLGIKPQNIHVWLHTTGKKNGLVRAVGQGLYRLEESMSMAAPRESVEAPRPVRRRVRNKRTSG